MTAVDYPLTRQGVRDLDHPIARSRVNVGPGERAVSALGGVFLAGFGLRRGGLVGLLLVATGGALACRGIAGHCPAYAAAGLNSAR